MKLLFLFILLNFSFLSIAQSKRDTVKLSHGSYEIEAAYPGGQKALDDHFKKNLKYPLFAKRDKLEDSVVVQYVIDSLGNITNARVLNAARSDLQQEALRLVYSQKQWTPYEMNTRHYKSYRKRTIYFKLK